jgi:transcription-repair coupling factor (superfamily II helicase)
MEIKTLKALFAKNPLLDETAEQLRYAQTRIHWKGLVGSAKALTAGAIAEQTPGNQLFILGDKEEAAYFLNDLESLYPDDSRILFYPASYRVPYQLEETYNANVVSRAEVLERINNGGSVWVVTYPQALFEKVPTQKKLAANTLRVEVGKTYSIDFINELLDRKSVV